MSTSGGELRIAAITMVWDEGLFLPLWLKHYGRHLGRDNLYVIDNDSDDGTTTMLWPSSRIRYPRGPLDEVARAALVSHFANAIRLTYDVIIVTDCDEFLVPDPALYASLRDYVSATRGDALASIGLNVQHILTDEEPFNQAHPVFSQRRHVQFVSPMCKPAITLKNVYYSPGFHNCSLKPTFGALYNFHLRWVDCGYTLKRLAMTRKTQWKDHKHSTHHRLPDEEILQHFLSVRGMEKRPNETFDFRQQVDRLRAKVTDGGDAGPFVIAQDIRDSYLTILPERFDSSVL